MDPRPARPPPEQQLTYLRRPGIALLLAACRERVERLGEVRGSAALDGLDEAEARDVDGLLGRGRRTLPGRAPRRVPLARVDAALRASALDLGLREALELTGAPLRSEPALRAERARADAAFWSARGRHPACREVDVRDWLAGLRRRGSLARLARRDDGRHLDAALAACQRIRAAADGAGPRPAPGAAIRRATPRPSRQAIGIHDRAELAAAVTGDPHALDDGRPAARLLLSLLASLGAAAPPRTARERRGLWLRHGVLPDALSSQVLCLSIVPVDSDASPLARALDVLRGEPVRLTLAQLAREVRHGLRFEPGLEVRSCENAIVVARAHRELGARCPPLVCTEGQPSAAADLLLSTLHDGGARLAHHSDFDLGGLRIAARLRRDHGARPWMYTRPDYLDALERLPDREPTLAPRALLSAGEALPEPAVALAEHRVPTYEEDVLDPLMESLARR